MINDGIRLIGPPTGERLLQRTRGDDEGSGGGAADSSAGGHSAESDSSHGAVAAPPLVTLSLDRATFKRVMGPLEDIMRRNMTAYATSLSCLSAERLGSALHGMPDMAAGGGSTTAPAARLS